jgi:hypothetical protein
MGKEHTNRGEVARYVVSLFLAHLVHSKVTQKAFLRDSSANKGGIVAIGEHTHGDDKCHGIYAPIVLSGSTSLPGQEEGIGTYHFLGRRPILLCATKCRHDGSLHSLEVHDKKNNGESRNLSMDGRRKWRAIFLMLNIRA